MQGPCNTVDIRDASTSTGKLQLVPVCFNSYQYALKITHTSTKVVIGAKRDILVSTAWPMSILRIGPRLPYRDFQNKLSAGCEFGFAISFYIDLWTCLASINRTSLGSKSSSFGRLTTVDLSPLKKDFFWGAFSLTDWGQFDFLMHIF